MVGSASVNGLIEPGSSAPMFWAKARPFDNAAAAFHPIAGHALDVAATATLLAGGRGIGIPPSTLGFLVALHDIGKFSRAFQAKVPAAWPEAALGPYPARSMTGT